MLLASAGVNGHIAKPIDIKLVIKEIRRIKEKKRSLKCFFTKLYGAKEKRRLEDRKGRAANRIEMHDLIKSYDVIPICAALPHPVIPTEHTDAREACDIQSLSASGGIFQLKGLSGIDLSSLAFEI